MTHYTLNAQYYQQFDADPEREVPGEGYGGWQTAAIDLAREHTGVVVDYLIWSDRMQSLQVFDGMVLGR